MKKFITQKTNRSKSRSSKSYAGLACVAFFFALFSTNFCFAQSSLLEENRADLAKIESYLNDITNLSAKFVQESNGKIIEGKFLLSRPGKMRIEYSAAPKILIVVNGSILSYLDVELDEVSRLSTNTTPASFLTRQNISFDAKDVELTEVKKTAEQIRISLMKKNRKEAGEFTLIFDLNPLKFVKMEVKNDLGQVVKVSLRDIDFTTPIKSQMFVIQRD